jgi:hypothetical protein
VPAASSIAAITMIELIFGAVIFDRNISTFDIAGFIHALPEKRETPSIIAIPR